MAIAGNDLLITPAEGADIVCPFWFLPGSLLAWLGLAEFQYLHLPLSGVIDGFTE